MINFKSPLLQALSWTTPLCSFWRQKRGKVRSVLFVSTNQSQLFCPHHMGHLTQMCFRLKILQEVQSKKRTAKFLLPGLSMIMVSAIQLQSEIIWNLWSRNLCKKWHRFPSLDLLSLPFTKVNHWVFFPSLPDVQQQKLVWLLESTPSTLAFKVVIWNGSHVVMLGWCLWAGKILCEFKWKCTCTNVVVWKTMLEWNNYQKSSLKSICGWAKLIATSQAGVHLKVELPSKT
jgi:hypothetical protein